MTLTIRDAVRADAPVILGFIIDLATYEKAADAVDATVDSLTDTLFGPKPAARAVIAEKDGRPVGFAIFFYSYSTWQARKGLYLEDLYVAPEARGTGAGKALLRHLARIALTEGCGRFEWSVLDWNAPAIRVYDAIGAKPQSEWIRYRLTGDDLAAFADGDAMKTGDQDA
ncbi:Acetyltransferase (GNAT) family protein [Rhizobium sp. RU20A]|uniref:GNAT family N-acetyltransferase n=1 Tax=Rhizobium sp. RU20A TaxID=1907412 RepID=UPI000955026F|nr:GNAT family N-acetyltransferase [Rhizobium sp. RU20A]SIR07375.1 Acetyltransferase (GNAT) family protein [Rhizobium sp. RU20A]